MEFFGKEEAASSIESGNKPCALVTTYVPSKSVAKKFSLQKHVNSVTAENAQSLPSHGTTLFSNISSAELKQPLSSIQSGLPRFVFQGALEREDRLDKNINYRMSATPCLNN